MNPLGEQDRLHFSHLPTPLEPMDRLGRYLGGPHLFIKRDDCTGLATGGNSTRKLEFLMADAIAAGADVVITQGPIQSNHARQTAAISSKLNMRCALALEDRAEGDDSRHCGSANVLLDRLYGADIHRFPDGFDMEFCHASHRKQIRSSRQAPLCHPERRLQPRGDARLCELRLRDRASATRAGIANRPSRSCYSWWRYAGGPDRWVPADGRLKSPFLVSA